jgi:hypothetical protein
MTDELKSGGPVPPPTGAPYVPPPDAGEPNPTSSSVPVQPTVIPPAQMTPPPHKQQTPPPHTPAPPLQQAPVAPEQQPPAPTGPTESLLGNLETVKPTVESLKIPDGVVYPKEFLSKIASTSSNAVEAQARFDTAHELFTLMQGGVAAKNLEWIQGLKKDPEVGGKNWEGSKDLYRKGVVEEFGVEFANSLAKSKLDAEPNFFKAVVRRMRAKNPSPVVLGDPIPKTEAEPMTIEQTAKKMYAGMSTGYQSAPRRTGPTF